MKIRSRRLKSGISFISLILYMSYATVIKRAIGKRKNVSHVRVTRLIGLDGLLKGVVR